MKTMLFADSFWRIESSTDYENQVREIRVYTIISDTPIAKVWKTSINDAGVDLYTYKSSETFQLLELEVGVLNFILKNFDDVYLYKCTI